MLNIKHSFTAILFIITKFISTSGVAFLLCQISCIIENAMLAYEVYVHNQVKWSDLNTVLQLSWIWLQNLFAQTVTLFSYVKHHWKHFVCIDSIWTLSNELLTIKHTFTTILYMITEFYLEFISTNNVTFLLSQTSLRTNK